VLPVEPKERTPAEHRAINEAWARNAKKNDSDIFRSVRAATKSPPAASASNAERPTGQRDLTPGFVVTRVGNALTAAA
jgi:hypothetical protein